MKFIMSWSQVDYKQYLQIPEYVVYQSAGESLLADCSSF